MEISQSGATFSSIVGIGEKIKRLSEETGKEFLALNRGVNAVTKIKLDKVIKKIDFNSNAIQLYPPNKGSVNLRNAINKEYFKSTVDSEKIFIVPGGMPALDLVFQTLNIEKLYHAKYFWGSYGKMALIRDTPTETYETLHELNQNLRIRRKKCAVIICDPNNPIGHKIDDNYLFEQIRGLNDMGVAVIFDSPYRRLFTHDDFFYRLSKLENVIITESFSKSVGLSGQRLGFIYSSNKAFCDELNIRVLYSYNGINGFAQELIALLLSTEEGREAVDEFRAVTVRNIEKNIRFLIDHELLYQPFYKNSRPVGIFAVVNLSEEELLSYRIGSVSMKYFTKNHIDFDDSIARICVSVPHEKFVEFFNPIIIRRLERMTVNYSC